MLLEALLQGHDLPNVRTEFARQAQLELCGRLHNSLTTKPPYSRQVKRRLRLRNAIIRLADEFDLGIPANLASSTEFKTDDWARFNPRTHVPGWYDEHRFPYWVNHICPASITKYRPNMTHQKSMRRNLKRLGLPDPLVLVTTAAEDRYPNGKLTHYPSVEHGPMRLSDASGRWHEYSGMALRASFRSLDGHFEGTIDCDGDVLLTNRGFAAAYLYSCCSDWGKRGPLTVTHHDAKVLARRLNLIFTEWVEGVYDGDDNRLHDDWFRALRPYYQYEKHSRFSDGIYGSATAFWRVVAADNGRSDVRYPHSYCY